ncbi:MAG: LOG family protein [Chlamydiia bacterium]
MYLSIVLGLFLTSAAPSNEVVAAKKAEPRKLTVALLGSDRNGNDKDITLSIKKLAKEIDPKKIRFVYNGGDAGLRYFFVQEFSSRGGEVTAYRLPKEKHTTPAAFNAVTLQNDSERLQQIYNDSDLFLVLPGGMETIGEMSFMIDQNAAKEQTLKPLLVFNINEYYKRFFQFIEYVEKEGFMDHRRLFKRSVKSETEITKILSQIYFELNKVPTEQTAKEPS